MKTTILVGGLFSNDGRVLLLRARSDRDHFPGHWELPGGKVKFGEHPDSAILREVVEETGLACIVKGIFHVFSAVPHGKEHVIQLNYDLGSVNDPEISLSREHSDHFWAKPTRIPEPVTEEIRATISAAVDLGLL